MTYLTNWLTIVLICSAVIMSPGPNLVITLRNSLAYTQRTGIYTALGLAVGDLIHISGWLVGIGVIITRSVVMFNSLRWVGAAYLIYLGIRSLQAKPHHSITIETAPDPQAQAVNPSSAFRMGLLTCLLNPKVTLFFFALFTQLIHPGTPVLVQVIYGITVASIEFLWFTTVAITISRPLIKRQLVNVSHWLERLMGVVLVGLGLKLAIVRD